MTSTVEKKDPPKEDEAAISREPAKVGGGVVAESPAADVDYSTISTTEPSPQNHGVPPDAAAQIDGSEISAITDHASLGGTMNPPSAHTTVHTASGMPDSVPAQVILPDGAAEQREQDGDLSSNFNTGLMPLAGPIDQPPGAPVGAHSIHSASAIPDPPPALSAAAGSMRTQPHSVSNDGDPTAVTRTPSTQQKQQNSLLLSDKESDDGLDSYIQSPEVQNAIVERSPQKRYVRFMEKLGSGATKDVYRAYDTQEGIEVAWNVVSLTGVPKTERNRIVNEVRLLERLHHANIISFHGSWVNRERQEVNFVTEILSSGTLKSFINKVQVILWKIAKRWAIQILKGLEYLHSQDPPVIHRDLKCENIFINGTSGDLRIGDLGLSTVHRNGKVLSVLGTPEFMAPDMYEERSYDEKVDIYAFGMCMLEILTKEIPYSECNNPAQIYKKVSAGEPPEILSRLQSRHAREFVELCMGYKDENGVYVRPSASELLKHPFLMKRPNDDNEVVVERPLRERPILETTTETSNGSSMHHQRRNHDSSTTVANQSSNQIPVPSVAQSALQVPDNGSLVSAGPTKREVVPSDEEGKDQFDEMPESETNMKKVKVLMGRDQVLTEDEDESSPSVPTETTQPPESAAPPPLPQQETQSQSSVSRVPAEAGSVQPSSLPQADPPKQPDSAMHYLVAAAVIENEGPDVRPYADDILKLVVTLPVEGQTQNVQFEFHLVEDDAVKVAKEMVQELDIPQEAVLEISETISGLACSARMKQDKYTARMQNQRQQAAQQALAPADPIVETATSTIQAEPAVQETVQAPASYAAVVSSDTKPQTAQQVPAAVKEVSVHSAQMNPAVRELSTGAAVQQPIQTGMPSAQVSQQQGTTQPPGVPPAGQPQPLSVSQAPAVPTVAPSQQNVVLPQPPDLLSEPTVLASSPAPPPQPQVPLAASATVTAMPSSVPPAQPLSQPQQVVHVAQTVPHLQQTSAAQVLNKPALDPSVQTRATAGQSVPAPTPASRTAAPEATQPIPLESAPISPLPSSSGLPPRPPTAPLSADSAMSHDTASRSTDQNGVSPGSHLEGLTQGDEMSEEVRQMLRKLEEDYQKNLKIAKKVFDSRMENLERSQTEKEAQHQKTLEKHEKERAAFEKRRALEEEQQLKRIEQLQKEWDKKREMLARQMTNQPAPPRSVSGTLDTAQDTPNEAAIRSTPPNGSQEHQEQPPPELLPASAANLTQRVASVSSLNTSAPSSVAPPESTQ